MVGPGRDHQFSQLLEFAFLLNESPPAVFHNRWTTESQADGQLAAGGMKGIRIDAASERLGGLAKLCMDPAQAPLIQERTGAIRLMSEVTPPSPRRPASLEQLLADRQVAPRFPVLTLNPLPLFLGDLDGMLPTAAATTMAAPVLQRWQLQRQCHNRGPRMLIAKE